jgi:hypothetical protein
MVQASCTHSGYLVFGVHKTKNVLGFAVSKNQTQMMEGIFTKKMMERGHFIFYIFLHVVSLIDLLKN